MVVPVNVSMEAHFGAYCFSTSSWLKVVYGGVSGVIIELSGAIRIDN